MTDSVFDYTSSKFQANFKTLYGKATEIALNLGTPYRARVKKSNDFTGSDKTGSVHLSLGGGRASGSALPDSNQRTVKKTILSKVETYGKYVLNRPTLIAGSDDKGSFTRSDKSAIKGTVDSVNLNLERMCFSQDVLGVIDSGGVSGANPYDCVISAATWVQANFLLGDYVNIETGNTDQFEITAIDEATRTIEVTRITGTQIPVATDEIFLQKSEGNEAIGYADAFDSGVTSLFNVTKQYGWEAHQVDAGGATISVDYLADIMIDVQTARGKAPTEIHASIKQYKNLMALTPNPQYYIGVGRSQDYKMSYKGISLLSPMSNEELPILANRFLKSPEVYLLNNEESEICFAPKFGWFEEGPQRLEGTTNYEYPFGGEWAHYFHPAYQARLYDLSV
jgi:hypothetical protein